MPGNAIWGPISEVVVPGNRRGIAFGAPFQNIYSRGMPGNSIWEARSITFTTHFLVGTLLAESPVPGNAGKFIWGNFQTKTLPGNCRGMILEPPLRHMYSQGMPGNLIWGPK